MIIRLIRVAALFLFAAGVFGLIDDAVTPPKGASATLADVR